jgi:hypothetical protein
VGAPPSFNSYQRLVAAYVGAPAEGRSYKFSGSCVLSQELAKDALLVLFLDPAEELHAELSDSLWTVERQAFVHRPPSKVARRAARFENRLNLRSKVDFGCVRRSWMSDVSSRQIRGLQRKPVELRRITRV